MRLAALEAVLPRHHQAQRGAVLVGQHLAVHAHREQAQGVASLVDPQRLGVRPRQDRRVAEAGQLRRIVEGGELDVARVGGRREAADHRGERDADPRDDHRPALDAAVAVDALFEVARPDQVLEGVAGGPGDFAFDAHRPRCGPQRVGEGDGLFLLSAQLVEVVVGGGVVEGRQRLGGAADRARAGAGDGQAGWRLRAGNRRPGQRSGGDPGHRPDELAAAAIEPFGRDLGTGKAWRSNQHDVRVPGTVERPPARGGLQEHERPPQVRAAMVESRRGSACDGYGSLPQGQHIVAAAAWAARGAMSMVWGCRATMLRSVGRRARGCQTRPWSIGMPTVRTAAGSGLGGGRRASPHRCHRSQPWPQPCG